MSSSKNIMMDDLLVKHLLGETSAQEALQVQEWIDRDQANEKYYEHFKLIWETSGKIAAGSTVNEEEAWQRFHQRMHDTPQKTKTIPLAPRRTLWMRAAAALAMVVIGGWLFYYVNSGMSKEIVVRSGEAVLTDTLSDGTIVTLNKHSSISYPRQFDKGHRDVTLTGEAFFNVAPDKSRPFLITANEASVKVVGTSFNVKTSTYQTEVIVETGVVVVAKEANPVILHPNERATVYKSRLKPEKQQKIDDLYNYYRTNELEFEHTPLPRVVEVLNEVYGVNIQLAKGDYSDKSLTVTLHVEPLDVTLNVVTESLGLSAKRDGDKIIIKK